MEENEFNLINYAIIARFNKEIKGFKKIYQATIDGDRSSDFHRKYDKNFLYSIVLIKSAGNRRFGGFRTQTWDFCHCSTNGKYDKNVFLFSLDKKKFILVMIKDLLFIMIQKKGHIFIVVFI